MPNSVSFSQYDNAFSISTAYGIGIYEGLNEGKLRWVNQNLGGTEYHEISNDGKYLITGAAGPGIFGVIYQNTDKLIEE